MRSMRMISAVSALAATGLAIAPRHGASGRFRARQRLGGQPALRDPPGNAQEPDRDGRTGDHLRDAHVPARRLPPLAGRSPSTSSPNRSPGLAGRRHGDDRSERPADEPCRRVPADAAGVETNSVFYAVAEGATSARKKDQGHGADHRYAADAGEGAPRCSRPGGRRAREEQRGDVCRRVGRSTPAPWSCSSASLTANEEWRADRMSTVERSRQVRDRAQVRDTRRREHPRGRGPRRINSPAATTPTVV